MGSDEISDSVYRDAVSKLKILLQNTAENEHPTLKVGDLQKIRGEKRPVKDLLAVLRLCEADLNLIIVSLN